MEHRYNLESVFKNFLSLRGIPYLFLHDKGFLNSNKEFDNITLASTKKCTTISGKPYYNDKGFYMPVSFKANGKMVEFPYAVISISQKKNIVSTSLQGRAGTVKELISISDADIDLTGMLVDEYGNYPEADVTMIKELFEINKSIEIICPLTDIILGTGVEVVIEAISYPSMAGVEDAQIVKMKLLTDKPFELVLS